MYIRLDSCFFFISLGAVNWYFNNNRYTYTIIREKQNAILCHDYTGRLSFPMLSRCSNLGIARAAPPCASSSANDQRRRRVIAMLHQGIGTSAKNSMHALKFSLDVSWPRTIGDISLSSAQQSANIRCGTRRLKMSQHIGDTTALFPTCRCQHRHCRPT